MLKAVIYPRPRVPANTDIFKQSVTKNVTSHNVMFRPLRIERERKGGQVCCWLLVLVCYKFQLYFFMVDDYKKPSTRCYIQLDWHKQTVYSEIMIQTFASSETENFFSTGKSRRLPIEILKRAGMRLKQIHAATKIEDLRLPPSNHLEKLTGQE